MIRFQRLALAVVALSFLAMGGDAAAQPNENAKDFPHHPASSASLPGTPPPVNVRGINIFRQTKKALFFKSAIEKQVKKDSDGAIADYLAVLKIDDRDPAVHWYLATAYQAAGKTDEANKEFQKERDIKKALVSGDIKRQVNQRVPTYPGGYGPGRGRGYGGGDFGSNHLNFVPGVGLTQPGNFEDSDKK